MTQSRVLDVEAPPSPYVERSRADWAALAASDQLGLDAETLERVRGLDDPTSLRDVRELSLIHI